MRKSLLLALSLFLMFGCSKKIESCVKVETRNLEQLKKFEIIGSYEHYNDQDNCYYIMSDENEKPTLYLDFAATTTEGKKTYVPLMKEEHDSATEIDSLRVQIEDKVLPEVCNYGYTKAIDGEADGYKFHLELGEYFDQFKTMVVYTKQLTYDDGSPSSVNFSMYFVNCNEEEVYMKNPIPSFEYSILTKEACKELMDEADKMDAIMPIIEYESEHLVLLGYGEMTTLYYNEPTGELYIDESNQLYEDFRNSNKNDFMKERITFVEE